MYLEEGSGKIWQIMVNDPPRMSSRQSTVCRISWFDSFGNQIIADGFEGIDGDNGILTRLNQDPFLELQFFNKASTAYPSPLFDVATRGTAPCSFSEE